MTFFSGLIVACFFCIGLNALTRKEQIFGVWQKVVRASDDRIRFQIARPLTECLLCMSSLYGAVFYGVTFGFSGFDCVVFGINGGRLFLVGFPVLVCVLFGLVGFLCFLEVATANKRIIQAEKSAYIATVAVFCLWQYGEECFFAFLFMVCLAGTNFVVETILSAIETGKETNETIAEHSVDQSAAIEEIIRAIKKEQ